MAKTRYLMDLNLSSPNAAIDPEAVSISLSDAQALGELLWHADQGTVDDEGGTIEESVADLKDTFDGKYGELLHSCSFKMVENGRPVAAIVITFYQKEEMPLVAFTMTHPNRKNRGLCQRLLRSAAAALRDEGYTKCFLAVTAANVPAIKAYEKAGFVVRNEVQQLK